MVLEKIEKKVLTQIFTLTQTYIARSLSNTESMINNCVLFSLIQFSQYLCTIFPSSIFCSNDFIKIKCQANQQQKMPKIAGGAVIVIFFRGYSVLCAVLTNHGEGNKRFVIYPDGWQIFKM